jgi:hypothetical protein
MIDGLSPVARATRAPQAKPASDPLASKKAAFDLQTEVDAEAERERAVLEQLVLAQLKDEDDIMKKWIAMID